MNTDMFQSPVSIIKAILFWLPIATVKCVQDLTKPIINLFVSRSLSETVSEKASVDVSTT